MGIVRRKSMMSSVMATTRTLKVIAAIAVAPAAPAAAAAVNGQEVPDTLTLADALETARNANPGLQAMRLRADAAAERISPAGALPDPQLSFGLLNRPASDFGRTDQAMTMNSVQLTQRFPWPGKLGFGQERVRLLAEADELEADETEAALVVWSGQYEFMQRVAQKLRVVTPITLGIIFLLLYLNFRGVTESLIVMLTLPFSLVGGVWFLWLLGYNTSVAVYARTSSICVVALVIFSLLPSVAVAQGSQCWICEPTIVLEPAGFARNVDADAGDVDFLVRAHVMARTGVPRLGVSVAVQWVVPHGNAPMVMAHLSYALLERPVGVAPFVGFMNVRFKGDFVIKPLTALYVTVPTGIRHVRVYGLGTVMFADDVVPSLALGLRLPFAPVPPTGGM